MSTGFVLRAPWYARARNGLTLADPPARQPAIQMYDNASFVERILADPRDSVKAGEDDFWSYPIPLTPANAHGRERFTTHTLIRTELRKLYQPTHDRYYAVVVEVFCDQPGLPRAGRHDELEVFFVMRRRRNALIGSGTSVRRLARNLVLRLARDQHGVRPKSTAADGVDVLWADQAWRRQFVTDNEELINGIQATEEVQAWMINSAGGVWRTLGAPPPDDEPLRHEEELPMWRLPARADCPADGTRSLWFGLVPTYAADHWPDENDELQPKLDDHEIYELVCVVREPPGPGREHCPPKLYHSAPSEPFRLAAPFDPDGTKNHAVTITAPDLRRLAARAGRKLGPGGIRIVTPPDSALPPVPFGSIPGGSAALGLGGSICSFTIELFFMIAFFLFLMFLPIVVFMFQLWWMLALRFCIPPSASFSLLAQFFAGGGVVAQLGLPGFEDEKAAFEEISGLPSGEDADGNPLDGAADLAMDNPFFALDTSDPSRLEDLVAAMDPDQAVEDIEPLPLEPVPDDPLCR